MLQLQSVSKRFGENQLYTDITFTLGNRERVGLVGANGTGKTTLLKLITGDVQPDTGTVISNEQILYLPQILDLDPEMMVGEYLESLVDGDPARLYVPPMHLSQISDSEIDEYSLIGQLSEGQKMKLYLTKLMVQSDSNSFTQSDGTLLIDEPTNHLDIAGIEWFEDFIGAYGGIVIMISHDRAFLNATTTHIYELDQQQLHAYTGNYDAYLEQRFARIEQIHKEFEAQERKRAQLERLLANARRISGGKQRGKKVKAAKKRMEREVLAQEIEDYTESKQKNYTLDGSIHAKKKMLELKNLSFAYPGSKQPIFHEIDFLTTGQEKIWLQGPNGSGKTTLIRLLHGDLQPTSGQIKWGNGVNFAYFAQTQEHLPAQMEVRQYFIQATNTPFERSFGALDQFKFDKTLSKNRIKDLSPGQRARLSFAIFAQGEYQFLILDEPTNHLDIETKELIEQALIDYQGNMILISHDRYFAESIGPDRIFTIQEQDLLEI